MSSRQPCLGASTEVIRTQHEAARYQNWKALREGEECSAECGELAADQLSSEGSICSSGLPEAVVLDEGAAWWEEELRVGGFRMTPFGLN